MRCGRGARIAAGGVAAGWLMLAGGLVAGASTSPLQPPALTPLPKLSTPSVGLPAASTPALPGTGILPTPSLPGLPLPSSVSTLLPRPSTSPPTPCACTNVPGAGPAGSTGSISGSNPGASPSANATDPASVAARREGADLTVATVGLGMAPPPAVQGLSPLPGISFGHAPYLWPAFAVLDVLALGGVAMVIRSRWVRHLRS